MPRYIVSTPVFATHCPTLDCRIQPGRYIPRCAHRLPLTPRPDRESPMSVVVTPHPAWVMELDRALEPHRLAVLATPVVEHSAENTLVEKRMQDFLISFYPIIRDFPQWLELLLERSPAEHTGFFRENIRVERRHDAMWRAMADGFGVPKGRFQQQRPMLDAVRDFHDFLTASCHAAAFAEAVAATNYAAGGAGGRPLAVLRVAAALGATLPAAVGGAGLDGHILTANHAAAELLGRPREELPRFTMDEIGAPAERAHVTNREQQAFRGQPQRYETTVVTGAGDLREVAVSNSPFVVEGELVGSVATVRDITDQKRAHETLARSESRYRNLFESASDAIVTFDANGRFTTVNHAAESISGYRREELVGQWVAPMITDVDLT